MNKENSEFNCMIHRERLIVSPIKQWRKEWLFLTAIGAILAASFDAVLLQRKHNLFTGGFLSSSHLSSPAEILGFTLISLLADAAVIGLMSGVLVFVFYTISLNKHWKQIVILAISLCPVIITNFISYELASYLGDVFDPALMYALVGKNPLEILAVSFNHSLSLLLIFLGIIGSMGLIMWKINSATLSAGKSNAQKPAFRKIFTESLMLFFLGFILLSVIRIGNDAFEKWLIRKPSVQLLGYPTKILTDFDGDGYGLLHKPSDPAPFNPRIFPYAADIPGNGVDEDGVAGDLPIEKVYYEQEKSDTAHWQFKPHIVFFMLESFRADIIGSTHKNEQVTPVLADLSKQGVSVQRAFSHNGFTVQSRYHTFSGSLRNSREGRSLIDDFKRNGYEVAFFSGQDESFGEIRFPIGLDRADFVYDGRDEPHRRYTTFSTPASLGLPYNVLLEKVRTFLKKRKSSQPLFLYLNFYDTHFPYYHDNLLPLIDPAVLTRFQIHRDRMTELKSMYLNTAANIDRALGIVLDEVRMTLKEVAVIVVSDHGESLFEDGFLGHGFMINDAQTRIPLIVTGLPIVIEEPFGQVDLREAINAALLENPNSTRNPALKKNPEKRVFQYIGFISQPRQIAMTDLSGRIIYDFRSDLVQVGGAEWRRPGNLDPSEYAGFQKLVHFWESILLANKGGKSLLSP